MSLRCGLASCAQSALFSSTTSRCPRLSLSRPVRNRFLSWMWMVIGSPELLCCSRLSLIFCMETRSHVHCRKFGTHTPIFSPNPPLAVASHTFVPVPCSFGVHSVWYDSRPIHTAPLPPPTKPDGKMSKGAWLAPWDGAADWLNFCTARDFLVGNNAQCNIVMPTSSPLVATSR